MGDGFVRPLTAEQKRLPPEVFYEMFGRDVPPVAGNVAMLKALDQTELLEFRGQRYHVPPVSFLNGLALKEQVNAFDRLARSSAGVAGLEATRDAFADLIRLMVTLVKAVPAPAPASRWRRLLAALHLRPFPGLQPHPFFDASVREVAELITFFSVRSRTSSVRSPSRMARHPGPSTSRPA